MAGLAELARFVPGLTLAGDEVGDFFSDVGHAVDSAVHAVQQGVGTVVDVANALRIPGVNLTTAILTGRNPLDALQADIHNFAAAANVARHVASGDFGAVAQDLTAQAARLGVHLPREGVQAAVAAAARGQSPIEVATAALGPSYRDAWNVATHYGTIRSALPAPPGSAYHPGARALPAAAAHPMVRAHKMIPLHVALAHVPIAVPVHMPSVLAAAAASLAEGTPMLPFAAAARHV